MRIWDSSLFLGLALSVRAFGATVSVGEVMENIGGDHSELNAQGLYFATTDGSRTDQWSQDDDLFRGAVDESPAWATPIDSGVGTSSGGWGYENVITSNGTEFEGGGGVTSDVDIETENELLSFDFGIDVPSQFKVGIYTDQADRAGAPFTPAAYRLEVGESSAEAFMDSFDLVGDIYWFELADVQPGDVLVVYETDSGTAQAGNAGVTGGVLFDAGDAPDPCDLTGDGKCDALDIDALSTEVRNGTNNPSFDLNGDAVVDSADRVVMVEQLLNTYFGDSNLDGEFSTADFVNVFQAGEFEDGVPGNSTWSTGDWNGDGDFGTGDFVVAFQAGGFEQGPRAGIARVPEPTGTVFGLGSLLTITAFRRRIQARRA